MDLMGMLGGILQQAEGGQTPPNVDQHFDTAAGAIGQGALGDVLSHVFNSPETPAFGQMLGGLFGQSSSGVQANVLNGLISAAGPAVLGGLMSGGALSGLAGMFGGGTPRQLTPQEAAQIPPQEVQQIAHQVQQTNPGIVDQMSSIYAAHPTLVKTLGTGAMMIALRKIAEMQQK
jgi:hypothetical protein